MSKSIQLMIEEVEKKLKKLQYKKKLQYNENKNDIMTHANVLFLSQHIDKDECLKLWGMSGGLEEDQVTAAEVIRNLYTQHKMGDAIFTNL
ncbi:MAG: hypothetical protein E6Q36_02840 [Chryseobacterium sp.]|nr:MAG: hypothetical protein E6Q36_02840 [Chryseobacterium sp.]